MAFVQEFSVNPRFPIGCNYSFITLIPKIDNHIRINDYHPISLIGLYFKIIAKLLANRLAPVLHYVIGLEQSAFLKSRRILDGPLLVNEMVRWFKHKKKKLMFLKSTLKKSTIQSVGIILIGLCCFLVLGKNGGLGLGGCFLMLVPQCF